MKLLVTLGIGATAALSALPTQATGVNVFAWGASGQTNIPADFTNVVATAAGDQFGVALKTDGKVLNWGAPPYGLPVPSDLSNVVQIAVGDLHTLALRNDGTVVVWGYNGYGQSIIPEDLSNVVAVAGGGYHS